MNLLGQIYITVGLIAMFGFANCAVEVEPNDIHEMIDLMYETEKLNKFDANDSATFQEGDSQDSEDSSERYADYDEDISQEDSTEEVENVAKMTSRADEPSPHLDLGKTDNKLLYSYLIPASNSSGDERKEDEKEIKDGYVEDKEEIEEEREDEEHKEDLEDKEEEEDRPERLEYEHDEAEEEDPSERLEDEHGEAEEDEHESKASKVDRITDEENEEEQYYEAQEEDDAPQEEESKYPRQEKNCLGASHRSEQLREGRHEDKADVNEDELGRAEEEDSDSQSKKENELNEPSTTRATDYSQTYEPHTRIKRPQFEFTTLQPYRDPKPVSYSSVVYDPVGTPKYELSGSFYQKPLKLVPNSNVFQQEQECQPGDAEVVPVTTPSANNEKAIPAPLYEDEDDSEEYMEAVTTNVNYAVDETDVPLPHRKILNLNPIMPLTRHSFEWRSAPRREGKPDRQAETEEGEPRESITTYAQLLNMHIDEQGDESSLEREPAGDTSAKYNEKTRENFLDQTNRENYYEQTISTRYGIKEKATSEDDDNHKSEVYDLMKPKAEEGESRREAMQTKESDEDEEDVEEIAQTNLSQTKDRNQLYEYIDDEETESHQRENVHDANERRQVYRKHEENHNAEKPRTENSVRPATEPPTTAEVKSTEKEQTTSGKVSGHQPQHYAFGTVVKPQTDHYRTFENRDREGDAIYNQIVNNIQSLFTTLPPPKSAADYEQEVLPSHGNCRGHHHDSINYESFVTPSHTHLQHADEEEEDSDEDYGDVNNPMPGSRRIPVKTYALQKRMPPIRVAHDKVILRKKEVPLPLPPPSRVKFAVHPNIVRSRSGMAHAEARPATYRNSVFLGPSSSHNALVKKVIYYEPKKIMHYSPSSQIMRIIRPRSDRKSSVAPPSSRRIIIREH